MLETPDTKQPELVLISNLTIRPDIRELVEKHERKWPDLWALRVCRVETQLIVIEGFALVDTAIAAKRRDIKAVINDSTMAAFRAMTCQLGKTKRPKVRTATVVVDDYVPKNRGRSLNTPHPPIRAYVSGHHRDRVLHRQFVSELRQKIRAAMLAEPDATCDDIAKVIGCSFSPVWKVREELSLEMPSLFSQGALKKRRRDTRWAGLKQTIIDTLIDNPVATNAEIARGTGHHQRTVGKIVEDLIATRPELFTSSQSDSRRKRPIEIDTWDTESQSWKLHMGVGGFLIAEKIYTALVAENHNRRLRVRRTQVLLQHDGELAVQPEPQN